MNSRARRPEPALYAQLQLQLLLAFLTVTGTAADCPAGDAVCTIADTALGGVQLFNQLADSTRTLIVRNVRLTDWQSDAIKLAGRATQLTSLVLNGATGQLEPQATGSPLQPLSGLKSLEIRGSCPFVAPTALSAASVIGWLNRLTSLTLADCRVGALNASWLRALPSLERLIVENAKVDSLQLGSLDEGTRLALRELSLANNSFNTLTDEAFGSMPRLSNLTLDGNIVQYIQRGAFAQLPLLRELSIVLPKEGQLAKIWETSLAGRFDNNTRLEVLRLANARLAEEQVSSSFEPLKQLRRLDLRGHKFRRLHNSVLSSLTSLEWLDLSQGSLACLYDRNFGVMSRLRGLSLAHNDIRVIGQRALLGLDKLQSLDLSGNPIEQIERNAFCSLPAAVKSSPTILTDWGLSPGEVRGGVNLSDPCPPDFDPRRLILSSKPQCLLARPGSDGAGGGHQQSPEQSRHTFLIIIGLCVAFLLITVISMMAYKGWSKRKNAQLAKDEEKELELQAMVAAAETGGTEDGAGGSGSGGAGGSKKPHNGRHHGGHHHQQPGSKPHKRKPAATGGCEEAAANAGAAATAGSSETTNNGEIETKAQVESPERAGAAALGGGEAVDSPASSAPVAAAAGAGGGSGGPKPPQMRPGITLMTTVPEDSDLEARAITTLVVV